MVVLLLTMSHRSLLKTFVKSWKEKEKKAGQENSGKWTGSETKLLNHKPHNDTLSRMQQRLVFCE